MCRLNPQLDRLEISYPYNFNCTPTYIKNISPQIYVIQKRPLVQYKDLNSGKKTEICHLMIRGLWSKHYLSTRGFWSERTEKVGAAVWWGRGSPASLWLTMASVFATRRHSRYIFRSVSRTSSQNRLNLECEETHDIRVHNKVESKIKNIFRGKQHCLRTFSAKQRKL